MRVAKVLILLSETLLLALLAACVAANKETASPLSSPLPLEPTSPAPAVPLETPSAGGPQLDAMDPFLMPLLHALTRTPPDYGALQAAMSSEFLIFDQYGAESLSPEEAIAQMRANYLPSFAAVSYNLDVVPDSVATFPFPATDEFIYTTGWGVNGGFMGVLVITEKSGNSFEWAGVFVSPDSAAAAGRTATGFTAPTRIEFETGATSATLWGNLAANGIHDYVAYAVEGQIMTVTIVSPLNQVHLTISGLSDGLSLVRSVSEATGWSGVLPASQDYLIQVVSGEQPESYTMNVAILTQDIPSSAEWVPLPAANCEDLEKMVAAELGVADIWLETNAPFEDFLSATYGRGCLISVSGTGADFTSFHDVYMRLSELLAELGWSLDMQYQADGPTGTHSAFRRDAGLILVSVGWEPSADANCPADQPISACDLAPEQQVYTIILSAATQ